MNIEEYLERNGVWHRFIEKPETIHTADGAEKMGIELNRLTKSLVLLDEKKEPVLAIIPGNCKLNFKKLRSSINAKRVWLVPFEEAENYSGYPPGATPMVHHKMKMKVVIDRKLLRYETIFGGGGKRTRAMEMRTEDVVRLNNAVVGDITDEC